MQKSGIVIQIQDQVAVVEVGGSGCGDHCDCSGSCEPNIQTIKVNNTLKAEVGDVVELSAEEGLLLKMTFLVYTVPLLAFVLGLYCGYTLAGQLGQNPEFLATLFGFLFAVIPIGFYAVLGKMHAEVVQMKRVIKSGSFPIQHE